MGNQPSPPPHPQAGAYDHRVASMIQATNSAGLSSPTYSGVQSGGLTQMYAEQGMQSMSGSLAGMQPGPSMQGGSMGALAMRGQPPPMTSAQYFSPPQSCGSTAVLDNSLRMVQPPPGPIMSQVQGSLDAVQLKQANDLFDMLDRNRDGVISRQELANLQSSMAMGAPPPSMGVGCQTSFQTAQPAAYGAQQFSSAQPLQTQNYTQTQSAAYAPPSTQNYAQPQPAVYTTPPTQNYMQTQQAQTQNYTQAQPPPYYTQAQPTDYAAPQTQNYAQTQPAVYQPPQTQNYVQTQQIQPAAYAVQMQNYTQAQPVVFTPPQTQNYAQTQPGFYAPPQAQSYAFSRTESYGQPQPTAYAPPQTQNYPQIQPLDYAQPAMSYSSPQPSTYAPPATAYSPPPMYAQPQMPYSVAQPVTTYSAPPTQAANYTAAAAVPATYLYGGQYGQPAGYGAGAVGGGRAVGDFRGATTGLVCQCGNVLLPDSNFCRKCGQRSDMAKGGPTVMELFDTIDRDRSGYISREEFAAAFHNRMELVKAAGTSSDCAMM